MEYPFITLDDGTQISHSKCLQTAACWYIFAETRSAEPFMPSLRRNGARPPDLQQTSLSTSKGSF
ncbi:MAG: hypothetical protein ACLR4A_09830 [Christensenellales bacterium]